MQALLLAMALIGYVAFFRWISNPKYHEFDTQNVKWYQDPNMPSCYAIWISIPLLLLLLSPLGLVLGYALGTLLVGPSTR